MLRINPFVTMAWLYPNAGAGIFSYENPLRAQAGCAEARGVSCQSGFSS
jgi:hypothetical protein